MGKEELKWGGNNVCVSLMQQVLVSIVRIYPTIYYVIISRGDDGE